MGMGYSETLIINLLRNQPMMMMTILANINSDVIDLVDSHDEFIEPVLNSKT